VELLPGGFDMGDENELLGEIHIANDVILTMTNHRRGNYKYTIFKKRRSVPWFVGRLKNFPRKSYHPWEMVRQILNQAAEQNGGRI
jgi:hypothetical protein